MAVLREFHGIAQQVDQHLAQTQRIADQATQGWRRLKVENQLQPLLLRLGLHHEQGVLHNLFKIETHRFECHLARLDL
ncbi:hypothetical protein SDC9_192249 [bioreactor metagenome]|uniref:Uncharacterized protein n=1 Tax=bioreactor metagenome TaxID=1076179 RepID=A0A645I8R1_9ZZZZ